ncbi:MAG: hypothetical protein AAFX99_23780, partial [Myxococcota bacterium]
ASEEDPPNTSNSSTTDATGTRATSNNTGGTTPTSNGVTTSNGTAATSNSTTTSTSNGTTSTSNGTTATSNGTTSTSNGTTSTSNGTTSTSNGTTATSNGTTSTSNGTTATSNGTTGTSNGTTNPMCVDGQADCPCLEGQVCEAGLICEEGTCRACDQGCALEDATRCEGSVVEVCMPNADGCLDWEVVETCDGPHQICDASGGDAMCTCEAGCEPGTACNDDNSVVLSCITDEDGCTFEEEIVCEEGLICEADEQGAACVAPCDNTCTPGETTCNDEGHVQACAENDQGCFAFETTEVCDENQVCRLAEEGQAVCTCDNVCQEGEGSCLENDFMVCSPDENGCLVWEVEATCTGTACEVAQCDPEMGCRIEPVECDDGIDCTEDSCDPDQGCMSEPNDLACDDGNVCTADQCVVGMGCSSTSRTGEACGDGELCGAQVCAAPARSAVTCAELGWGGPGTAEVCAASRVVGNETECSGDVTHAQAVAICDAAGARLCTLVELERDETRGTGCGYDDARVWSQSSCGPSGMWTRAGNTLFQEQFPTTCTDTEGFAAVRCCADVADTEPEPSCIAPEEEIACALDDDPCTVGQCLPDGTACNAVPVEDGTACELDPISVDICQSGACTACFPDGVDPIDNQRINAQPIETQTLIARVLCSGDVDWFTGTVEDGQSLGVVVHNGSGICSSSQQTALRVRRDSQLLGEGGGIPQACAQTLPIDTAAVAEMAAGSYDVRVGDNNTTHVGPYRLTAVVFEPHPGSGTGIDNPLEVGEAAYYSGSISPNERAWYAFTADGQTAYAFDTNFAGCPTDTILELYTREANGELNLFASNNNTQINACARLSGRDFNPLPAGDYMLAVRKTDPALPTDGRYALKITREPSYSPLNGPGPIALIHEDPVLIQLNPLMATLDFTVPDRFGDGRPARVMLELGDRNRPGCGREVEVSIIGAAVSYRASSQTTNDHHCIQQSLELPPGQYTMMLDSPPFPPTTYNLQMRLTASPWP